MENLEKQGLMDSIIDFGKSFQKEVLDLIPENNRSGLSPLQYKMLHEIHLLGSLNLAELSTRLSISASNASRDVRKLHEQMYLIKVKDQTDKRVIHLMLTAKGTQLVEESMRNMNEIFFRRLDVLSRDEIQQLALHFRHAGFLLKKISELNP